MSQGNFSAWVGPVFLNEGMQLNEEIQMELDAARERMEARGRHVHDFERADSFVELEAVWQRQVCRQCGEEQVRQASMYGALGVLEQGWMDRVTAMAIRAERLGAA